MQSARTIYERWLEAKNINPVLIKTLCCLTPRQARKWRDQARACGMGGDA